MDLVWFWSIMGVILVVLEMLTVSFFAIFLAFAAFITAILSFFVNNIYIQIAVFSAISILSTLFGKPFFKKYFKVNVSKKASNIDAFTCKIGVVTKEIQEYHIGQVKVDGSIWSAVSLDGKDIPIGTKIEVETIDGVKLIVKQFT